jgi:carbon-monoxide dehydrogenase small subunit/xanthine dehydrogenase small subunit
VTSAETVEVAFTLNGRAVRLRVAADRRLIDLLRADLRLTGTKEGCGEGQCGACTVVMDGRAVSSCLTLALQADGTAVETVEGLGGAALHPLQQALEERGAVHCGACIPGVLMSAKALLDSVPSPSPLAIRDALSGNLCRCAGYGRFVAAVGRAAQSAAPHGAAARGEGAAPSYFRPRSLEEALEILAQRGEEAQPAAGATLVLALGRRAGATLFDVTSVPEMKGIEERGADLWMGALSTFSEVSTSPLVARYAPPLRLACAAAGPPQLRNRATIGGALAANRADADALTALLAADALIEVVSVSSRREPTVSALAAEGDRGGLAPDELIVGVRIPRRPGVRGAYRRLAQRRGNAAAKISLAASMTFNEGRPDWARIALGSVGPTVLRAHEAENALMEGGHGALVRAKEAVRAEIRPVDDLRSTAEYRSEMAAVLLERAVRDLSEA